MALTAEKGTFTKRSGTGSQTVTLADSSITPKVLWLWTSGVTTANAYAENYLFSYGFSDGTNDACIAGVAVDNGADSTTAGTIRDDSAICLFNTNTVNPNVATVASKADVTSFNAGNFILNWSTATSAAEIIHYRVVGGSDITNVKVISSAVNVNVSGNASYTGVGFAGDFINMLGGVNISVNTQLGTWHLSNGAATSSSAQWQHGTHTEHDASSADTGTTFSTADIVQMLRGTSTITDGSARFVSFDSDGFTINWIDNPNTTTQRLAALVIKGGTWNVGNGTAPATATTQNISTTASTDVKGVMMFTHGGTTTPGENTFVTESRFNIGGADSALHEGSTSVHDTNAVSTMVNTRYSSDTKIIRSHTAAATASSSTTNAEADISSMSTSGQFTISWSTTLSGMRYAWFAASQGVSTTPVSETSIHKYNLLQNVAQTNIHKYNMIGNIAQTNIHKYHVLNNIAQTNIHKYNLLQNVLQSNIHKYNLAAYIAQTSIQKYNLLAYILQTNIHKYDILNFITPSTSIHKYNLFKNIAQTSIHKYNLLQNILQTSIHKYHMSGLIAALSIHKYNLSAFISQSSIHKYNLFRNITQNSIHKYNILANILQTSIHKYNLLQNLLTTSIQKYNLLQNALSSSIQKYNLLQNILQTSIHKYDILVLGAVVNALIAKYNILQNVAQTNVHKYNVLKDVLQTSIHKYNVLVNILQNSIHKYGVLQNVLQTSLHKYALLQNVVQSSIHKYDILISALTVLANSIHKYNIFKTVTETSIHKYSLLQDVLRTSIHKYNVLRNILQASIHKYNMGGKVVQDSIHKYKVVPLVQEIFSSRIMGRGPARQIPKLKQIRYPVYSVTELKYWERRRKLREFNPVIIPAFSENMNRTVAPFVVTNPLNNTISVKFAIKRTENVRFVGKSVPIAVSAASTKKQMHKARCASFVMNQKAIEKYGKRLNKVSKLLKLLLLAENNPFKQ